MEHARAEPPSRRRPAALGARLLPAPRWTASLGRRPSHARRAAAARAAGDLVRHAMLLNNIGIAAYYAGRWEEAVEHYRRAAS